MFYLIARHYGTDLLWLKNRSRNRTAWTVPNNNINTVHAAERMVLITRGKLFPGETHSVHEGKNLFLRTADACRAVNDNARNMDETTILITGSVRAHKSSHPGFPLGLKKTGKPRKIGRAFSSQGKVREFLTDWKSRGKSGKKLGKSGNFRQMLFIIFSDI